MDKRLKYYDLMEQLHGKIMSGEIRPGEKLPSENELSAEYGVSRQTVRKALQILQNEGYIYAEHGRGTFCSEMLRHTTPSKNIAVVTTYLSDYIFPRIVQGIEPGADGERLQYSPKKYAPTREALRQSVSRSCCRRISTGLFIEAEQEPDFLPGM